MRVGGSPTIQQPPVNQRKWCTPHKKEKTNEITEKFTEKKFQGRVLLTAQDSTPCTTAHTPAQHTQEDKHSTQTSRKKSYLSIIQYYRTL